MSSMRVCPECGTETEAPVCPKDGEMTLVLKKKEDPTLGRIGELIAGRYRVLKVIGQGGFGAVFKAQHTATGDTVAIKVLRTDVAESQDVIARFRQEAKATSKLKHPNTVRVFDFGQMDDGNLYIAMEFLEGTTFSDLMRKEGPIEPRRIVHIAGQVLKALSEAHSKGIVHRDLKPDNIFIQAVHNEPDYVKVLDFGIAKSLAGDSTQGDMTSTGAILGTPRYMSPEQARGAKIDARTDLYSLGLILYECMTGVTPFVADSPLSMLLKRVQEEPPRVHDCLALPTPEGMCDVVLRSLQRDPEQRWASADEMLQAMNASVDTVLLEAKSVVPMPGMPPLRTAKYEGEDTHDETMFETGLGPAGPARAATGKTSAAGAGSTATPAPHGTAPGSATTSSKMIVTSNSGGLLSDEGAATMATMAPPELAALGRGPTAARAPIMEMPTRLEQPEALGLPRHVPTGGSAKPPTTPAPASAPSASPPPAAAKNSWAFVGIGGGVTAVVALAIVVVMQGGPAPAAAPGPEATTAGTTASGTASTGTNAAGDNPGGTHSAGSVAVAAPATPPGAPSTPPAGPAAAAPAPALPSPSAPPPVAPPAVPAPVPGALVPVAVQRSPTGAKVSVDGQPLVGDTTALPPGKHTITASADGYLDHSQEIEIGAGDTIKIVKVDLKRKPSGPRPPGPRTGDPGGTPPPPPPGGKPRVLID